ncbi:MAG TPA: nickel-dependent hydrogenase large subunit [Blastocatellia bacterium]|nr:nickel-dependent hydrogenase large subunit [Blastocatellia bacterium]
MSKRIIQVNMNRVEGDLEIKIEVEGHVIRDAWCVGSMYRGYEKIMVGRDPNDALVITPRICGICSTTHLYAAARALESVHRAPVAPNGTRIRNLCLAAESVQSDIRHTFLMFLPDFCDPVYRGHVLYEKVVAEFAPLFRGRLSKEVVHYSKKILGIIIAFGGQWPHSSYMMPGGVTVPLIRPKLLECNHLIDDFIGWYERSILGCPFEKWLSLETAEAFSEWLDNSKEHRESAVGLFARFGRSIRLNSLSQGAEGLLSYGGFPDPNHGSPDGMLDPSGYYNAEARRIEPFRHEQITEDVSHSWFQDYEGGRHPWESHAEVGDCRDSRKYTYAKATRYDGEVVQLGPIADLVIARDPLITSLFKKEGASTWLRQFCRFHRPVKHLSLMKQTLSELVQHLGEPTHTSFQPRTDGEGVGTINAARGSLGHWIKIKEGKIANYQIITPTTWNASPRDSAERRGHWESSLIGVEIQNLEHPIELSHIVRSHDACLVCTVHFAEANRKYTYGI